MHKSPDISCKGYTRGNNTMTPLPTKAQVDEAVSSLAEAAKIYSDSPDLEGYASRVEIIARAKSLIRAVVSPDMMPNYHGLNVCLKHRNPSSLSSDFHFVLQACCIVWPVRLTIVRFLFLFCFCFSTVISASRVKPSSPAFNSNPTICQRDEGC